MEFAVLLVVAVLTALALGPVAFARTRRLQRELDKLRADLAALHRRLAPETPEARTEAPTPPPEHPAEPATGMPAPIAADAMRPTRPDVAAPPPPPEPVTAPPPTAPAAAPSGAGPRGADFEERLTSRWLVWVGGVALALGGVFLVKYSLERGLLGPAARVALGLAFGALLVAAGEWLLRRPLPAAGIGARADYVPPALTAAGIVTLLGTLYSAHALYGLVPAGIAFPLLAAVAAGAVTLSLRQGPLIGALGVLAGFLVPALVGGGEPSPWPLFGYLALLTAGALAIGRVRPAWWWLGWLTWLGAVAVWPPLWIVGGGDPWGTDDTLAVGAYLVLVPALFALALDRDAWVRTLVALAAGSGALLLLAVVSLDDHRTAGLTAALLSTAVSLGVARGRQRHHGLPVIGAALGVAVLASWYVAPVGGARDPFGFELPGPLLPEAIAPFALTGLAFAALTGGGGFAALWGAARPALWAAVSAVTPVLLLAAAYVRLRHVGVDLAWSAGALALAGVLVAAADRVARHRDAAPRMTRALAAYAVGVVAALCLAATMALEEAWLTVALSLQVPALAWVHERLGVPALRRVAAVVAVVVLVRLALNPYVLDYPLGAVPALNWLLYGYGVPAAAFLFAARMFRRSSGGGDDGVVALLEGGGLAFVAILVSLEIRSLVQGDLGGPLLGTSLLEISLRSIAWLAIGFALFRSRASRSGRTAAWWGGRVLAGLAAGQVAALQLVDLNPLWHPVSVGAWPVLNLLLLAYLAPAGFAVLFAREAERQGERAIAAVAGLFALVLPLVYLTLEVRRAFQGSVLAIGATGAPTGDAEWYAYSVAWLAYAGLLLALGLLSGRAALRHASLALILAAVAKVFLFDMAGLTGLYRAASFIGLGLALVGVGWLYQRFVFPRGGRVPT